ncbi:hypothetical protein DU99_02660 [Sinorhizobium meliloti]|nr:hypothetical protein DU99_02660 [Sinorhizobium meliloti]
MNVKRGLFRLWLVLSALFVLATFGVMYNRISEEFNRAALAEAIAEDTLMVPVECPLARGEWNKDFQTLPKQPDRPNPWEGVPCWYELPRYRELYPETAALSDEEIASRQYTSVGRTLTHPVPPTPWRVLARVAVVAFSIPLLILLIGSAFVWAFSGFLRERT